MEFTPLLIFALALLVSAGSPGPSIAALVTRVLVKGWRDVMPFLAAMWLGEAIWLTCAVAGLVVLMDTFYWAFQILKYCGVAYLIYLAWRMWTAPVSAEPTAEDAPRGRDGLRMFLAGMAVTLGNPKIMVFYLALLPTIIDLQAISLIGWVELTFTMLLVLIAVDCAYVIVAARARLMLKNPRAMRIANRVSAGVMGGAAAAIATR
ncbi:LysE family translocator [Aestuariispira insulae]|uniref:Threonine/homoserine/homoserine lactone efflux protein n=1 Tax=Aestuariispira insulae TaxID=1461337 RepID=A0A3D9HT15_9PROT|nr:LysE family translocator [Aestuariispira insulae]RED52016.1 threonine/homoserine/homoserine lactone efflux protein [Aestuariispira insulae]